MPVNANSSDDTQSSVHRLLPSVSIIETIIDEVLAMEGCEHHEIPPLYDSIDPDALAALYASGSPTIRFQYAGYRIEISPERTISVTNDD
ncbi:HalOD1 output domain-containing protein [Haladaptatus sp. DYF46]|uniref:HalOD1 output domain-containing protein n=1 Tax=Haladaptatus sp. DYF46 TaxID=2886041 RepID=UPI001E4280E0|nr:HalOD1 output domain-containing protein [Haladaptatus sp. DYF46]